MISRKNGFEFPQPASLISSLKYCTLLHKHCIIDKAIVGGGLDFNLLIEEDINIFFVISEAYGPYLKVINTYFA
tara:strand:- start:611 stop:832 length:222 start_codon:yes stop_codon:yes gene_type:complete